MKPPLSLLVDRCWFVAIITMGLSVTTLDAQQLPDAEWMAYFGGEGTAPKELKISTMTPFGPQEFIQRVKPNGTVVVGGSAYRKSVLVHDSGPFANQVIETFIRIADDGLYERNHDGNEVLLAPRPLAVGQTWTNGNETFRFEGIEDFATFSATIPACLKITIARQGVDADGTTKEEKHTKYYERGKGQIYKRGTGYLPYTKILSRYAGQK